MSKNVTFLQYLFSLIRGFLKDEKRYVKNLKKTHRGIEFGYVLKQTVPLYILWSRQEGALNEA